MRHIERKNPFWIIFKKSGKFSLNGFLVFSYCTGSIVLENGDRTSFEVLVSMGEGPKHGVPWPREITLYPQ